MRERTGARFEGEQRAYFESADEAQLRWTTTHPVIAASEDELLAPVLADAAAPCLELGCGEGNNLVRLARVVPDGLTGVDLFPAKLRFARRELPGVSFCASDGGRLPFADARFQTVVVRDVLHHVADPALVLGEAVRVLARGGRLWLLEPNGRNPLIRLQIALVPAERGARDSNPEAIRGWLESQRLTDIEVEAAQPLPLARVVFHYRMGAPDLATWRGARAACAVAERALGFLLPRSAWTYVVARATRA